MYIVTRPNIDEGENVFLPDNDQSHNPGATSLRFAAILFIMLTFAPQVS